MPRYRVHTCVTVAVCEGTWWGMVIIPVCYLMVHPVRLLISKEFMKSLMKVKQCIPKSVLHTFCMYNNIYYEFNWLYCPVIMFCSLFPPPYLSIQFYWPPLLLPSPSSLNCSFSLPLTYPFSSTNPPPPPPPPKLHFQCLIIILCILQYNYYMGTLSQCLVHMCMYVRVCVCVCVCVRVFLACPLNVISSRRFVYNVMILKITLTVPNLSLIW